LKEWKETGEVSEPKEGKEPAEAKSNATEAEGDGKQPAKAEAQPSSYDRLLERASQEPDFDKVVERLHEPFFPLSAEGYARYQVLNYAVNPISNPGDVVYFFSRPENSSIALKMQDAPPHKIAQIVHMISAELRFGGRTAKRAEEDAPRPRAPRPPSEVGGRGAGPTDTAEDAVRRNDFRAAEAEWNRRAIQRNSPTARR
jgi:hypothetical protein